MRCKLGQWLMRIACCWGQVTARVAAVRRPWDCRAAAAAADADADADVAAAAAAAEAQHSAS